ncbi:uncharacterized protein LOC134535453 [Bacillus rossius redtenbacheri]|uniref:uncharacterized protein LOC134535453 n=1 Tax=Bacillus rossius redtenbacheri TaxID=93214 RepID=UPI002FDCD404
MSPQNSCQSNQTPDNQRRQNLLNKVSGVLNQLEKSSCACGCACPCWEEARAPPRCFKFIPYNALERPFIVSLPVIEERPTTDRRQVATESIGHRHLRLVEEYFPHRPCQISGSFALLAAKCSCSPPAAPRASRSAPCCPAPPCWPSLAPPCCPSPAPVCCPSPAPSCCPSPAPSCCPSPAPSCCPSPAPSCCIEPPRVCLAEVPCVLCHPPPRPARSWMPPANGGLDPPPCQGILQMPCAKHRC